MSAIIGYHSTYMENLKYINENGFKKSSYCESLEENPFFGEGVYFWEDELFGIYWCHKLLNGRIECNKLNNENKIEYTKEDYIYKLAILKCKFNVKYDRIFDLTKSIFIEYREIIYKNFIDSKKYKGENKINIERLYQFISEQPEFSNDYDVIKETYKYGYDHFRKSKRYKRIERSTICQTIYCIKNTNIIEHKKNKNILNENKCIELLQRWNNIFNVNLYYC